MYKIDKPIITVYDVLGELKEKYKKVIYVNRRTKDYILPQCMQTVKLKKAPVSTAIGRQYVDGDINGIVCGYSTKMGLNTTVERTLDIFHIGLLVTGDKLDVGDGDKICVCINQVFVEAIARLPRSGDDGKSCLITDLIELGTIKELISKRRKEEEEKMCTDIHYADELTKAKSN